MEREISDCITRSSNDINVFIPPVPNDYQCKTCYVAYLEWNAKNDIKESTRIEIFKKLVKH